MGEILSNHFHFDTGFRHVNCYRVQEDVRRHRNSFEATLKKTCRSKGPYLSPMLHRPSPNQLMAMFKLQMLKRLQTLEINFTPMWRRS
jgi:hypothetical protein